MKKRSCRRTKDESWYHDKAVKLRKMTDEQLINYVEDRVEKARSEGMNEGKKLAAEEKQELASEIMTVAGFLKELAETKVQGIGTVTIRKLEGAAKQYGYI